MKNPCQCKEERRKRERSRELVESRSKVGRGKEQE